MPHLDRAWVDPTQGETMLGTPSLDDLRGGTLDLVLAVPKSVSVYYAALRSGDRRADAERIVELHESAVKTSLGYLNREAAWAKIADPYWPSAAEYRDSVAGLRVIQLEHDMAAPAAGEKFGDPHIHTHLFVDPELTAAHDNRPYPLDVDTFAREVPAARALYERALAEQIMSTFRVRFDRRPGSPSMEIIGIDDADLAAFPATECRPFAAFRQFARTAGQLAA